MQYLYNGSAEELPVQARDILELMAAANFFQVNFHNTVYILIITRLFPPPVHSKYKKFAYGRH